MSLSFQHAHGCSCWMQSINKSLSCLGDVVQALDKGSAHIPYRNSKLTYILQVLPLAGHHLLWFPPVDL